jgi:starch phosphorylase
VQDILTRHYQLYQTYDNLADKIAIHLNDTHPVLSIPELMRLLIDEHSFSWDDAFEVTCQVFSYTNHTLMSEALETWPVDMLGKILPRHLQIIFEINDYFLKTMQEHYPDDIALLSGPRLSMNPTAAACGWPGWRWWSATRLTGCRNCTPG